MKNKGFTLIELLAVILILGIIALIATPIVNKVIKEARINSAIASSRTYLKTVEEELSLSSIKDKKIEDNIYTIENKSLILNNNKILNIKIKGNIPNSGEVYIRDNKITKACLKINNYDFSYDGKDIINGNCKYVFNLMKNGYLENKNNDYFKEFTYEDESLKYNGTKKTMSSDQLIEVDRSKEYYYSVSAKSNVNNSLTYLAIQEFDADKNNIMSFNVYYTRNTLTKLSQDLNPGDTVIYFEDISNFINNQNGLIFWDYKNSSGYKYPPETYSRYVFNNIYIDGNINYIDNTITLKKPWEGNDFKEGTSLSQCFSSGSFNYVLLNGCNLNNEFQKFETTLSFDKNKTKSTFFSGTKYVKFLLLHNYNDTVNKKTTYLKDIVFEEIK